MSATEFKRKKDLDAKRQAGTLPPEQDEDGNMINPHNPDYITKRPWYLGNSGPSLKHQNVQKHNHVLSMAEADGIYVKGARMKASTKFRKGACENCGAMTHKKKDCVERPRKVGAWKTKKNIKADEVIQPTYNLGFAGKRDHWIGYNPDEHALTVQRYQAADVERQKQRVEAMDAKFHTAPDEQTEKLNGKKGGKKKKKKKLAEGAAPASGSESSDSDTDSDSDSDSDYESDDGDDEKEEFLEREGGAANQMAEIRSFGTQRKSTVRNLRIREDTAKYLRNLDPNSAYYDPKTRSMRDNPNPMAAPEDLPYAGDNFVRITGDAVKLAKTQLFAWEAYEKGQEIHAIANPSQAELLQKRFEEKKDVLEDSKKTDMLEKYGGREHLKVPPREMLLAQTESYVEYSRDGRVIKGLEKAVAKSKYEEDVYLNNHTAVWGSYFNRRSMTWGFACCHSSTKNSYCTGATGREANNAAGASASKTAPVERAMIQARPAEQRDTTAPTHHAADVYGENLEPELDQKKLQEALRKEKEFLRKAAEEENSTDRKRKYNSMTTSNVTQEEMEAYRTLKTRSDDPMAKLMDSGMLLGEDGTMEAVPDVSAAAAAVGGAGGKSAQKKKKKKGGSKKKKEKGKASSGSSSSSSSDESSSSSSGSDSSSDEEERKKKKRKKKAGKK